MTIEEQQVQEGRDAFANGVALYASPYPRGSEENLRWRSGWMEAASS